MSHLRVSSAGLLARVSGKCAMSIRLPEIAMSKPLMRLLWYLFTGPCIYQTARPWNVYQRFGRSEYLNISRIHLPTLPVFFNKCGFGLIALATFDFEPPSFGNGISCLNTDDRPMFWPNLVHCRSVHATLETHILVCEHTYLKATKKLCLIVSNSATDWSISLKFGTEFDHATADTTRVSK